MKNLKKYIVLYMMIMGIVWFLQSEKVEGGIRAAEDINPLSTEIVSITDGQDSRLEDRNVEMAPLPFEGEEDLAKEESGDMPVYYAIKNHVHYKGSSAENKIALTFDDGPDPYYTEQVLDVLKEHQVKATFFLIGAHVEKYPQVVARIAQEGHTLGNHSMTHRKFTWLSASEIHGELEKTGRLIDKITGYHPNIFRPPFGTMNKKTLEKVNAAGYNVVNWSVDTKDWNATSVPRILYYVKQQLKPGGIILMHSSGKKQAMDNMLTALPEIIQYAREKEYVFVTVPEVLEMEAKQEE